MSESPIERALAAHIDNDPAPDAAAAGALIDYTHEPVGPAPDLTDDGDNGGS